MNMKIEFKWSYFTPLIYKSETYSSIGKLNGSDDSLKNCSFWIIIGLNFAYELP